MHSPFIVIPNFISSLTCEKILQDIKVGSPDLDIQGDPVKLEKTNLKWEQPIINNFQEVIPQIETQYNCNYKGLEKPVFQFYPENAKRNAEDPGCENAKFARKKWVQVKDVDLVGFIWLKDFNQNTPIDTSYEVYGGRMEFPVYNFSVLPQRGTLLIFPAGPHFINVISPILVSDLYQIKLNMSIKEKDDSRWFYQPSNFSGTYQEWFQDHV
jgi:hypothetical protein